MSVDVRWNAERGCYSLHYTNGTPDDEIRAAWGAHQRASVGEGFCPTCRNPLIPYTSDEGPVQLCPAHGWWQINYSTERFSWWSSRDQNGFSTGPRNATPA